VKKSYRVVYAGIPSSECTVSAGSPRDAAIAFFAKRPLQNSVIVRTGILREEVFGWHDFAKEIPELQDARLPLGSEKLPPYDPARDPIVRLFRAGIIFTGIVMLMVAALAFVSGNLPGVAVVFLALSGIVTLLAGTLASARTLRRCLTRDPSSLDAR
jgi:hypothetical protein